MKILNLYAGLGGNRKLWGDEHQVFAVELDPKIAAVYRRLYPKDVVLEGDAHRQLLVDINQGVEYDFIWSSPPCQSHSKMALATRHSLKRYPDLTLYEEIILLKTYAKCPWVVENVIPHYKPLIAPEIVIDRHMFWSNFGFIGVEAAPPKPKGFINLCNLAGKKAMMDWLGIHYSENIYYGKNHCPAQILRNCVHPNVGRDILEAAKFGKHWPRKGPAKAHGCEVQG